MTLHLIGLGLDKNSLSLEGKEAISKCKKVYLEGYTVNFPYDTTELEQTIEKSIDLLDREEVENEEILKEAKEKDIALLVYGDSLSATTHIQLILSCKKQNIPYKIYHNASIITAIANTGLQLYKFGKIASMPKWTKSYEPTSFLNYYLENSSIKAHTLILTDIDLKIDEAIYQLEFACNKEGIEIGKIIVVSGAGTKEQKIYYDTKDILKKSEVKMPFCIIIPDELHFIEQEALMNLTQKSIDDF